MKVVILCGGMGTRLREETEYKPKAMVDVGGKPILWHIMKLYDHHGHRNFILPIGYKGEMIKAYFLHYRGMVNDFTTNLRRNTLDIHNHHEIEDWNISIVDTGLEAKTALRLFRCKHLLENEDMFMLTYGDGLSNININELIEFHKKMGKITTITGLRSQTRYGTVKEKNGIVHYFTEKPMSKEFINGGFMVFNKEIWNHLDESDVMLVDHTLPKLAKMKELAIHKHNGFWKSVDTYRDYIEINRLWKENPEWKVW